MDDIQLHPEGYWYRKCNQCNKHIKNKYKSQIKQKTCSHHCQLIGNKYRLGKMPANAWKKGETSGPANVNWRGANPSYGALHDWVSYHLGRPKLCENCNSVDHTRYEWANISGEYRRDLIDWVRLCKTCHVLIDNSDRGFRNRD
jgi:hypothetical protein